MRPADGRALFFADMNRTRRGLAAALALALVASAIGAWLACRAPSRYFTASELDHVATPLSDIGLAFPKGREGIDYFGTLRMDVYIDEAGRVDRVQVLESTVPRTFRDSAVGAFSRARFEPALRKGRAVKSIKKVEVRFAAPLSELNRGS
jgi:TonB family protein